MLHLISSAVFEIKLRFESHLAMELPALTSSDKRMDDSYSAWNAPRILSLHGTSARILSSFCLIRIYPDSPCALFLLRRRAFWMFSFPLIGSLWFWYSAGRQLIALARLILFWYASDRTPLCFRNVLPLLHHMLPAFIVFILSHFFGINPRLLPVKDIMGLVSPLFLLLILCSSAARLASFSAARSISSLYWGTHLRSLSLMDWISEVVPLQHPFKTSLVLVEAFYFHMPSASNHLS